MNLDCRPIDVTYAGWECKRSDDGTCPNFDPAKATSGTGSPWNFQNAVVSNGEGFSTAKNDSFGRIMVRLQIDPENLIISIFECKTKAGGTRAVRSEYDEYQCPISETREESAEKFWTGHYYIYDVSLALGGKYARFYNIKYQCRTEKRNDEENSGGWWKPVVRRGCVGMNNWHCVSGKKYVKGEECVMKPIDGIRVKIEKKPFLEAIAGKAFL